MSTILFISFFLVLITGIILRLSTHRKIESETSRQLPALQFDGLFAARHAEEARALVRENARLREDERRRQLLSRAAQGELRTLDEAQALGCTQFYCDVLRAVFTQADGNPRVLQSIAEHIVDSRTLRSSSEFSDAMITLWRESQDQSFMLTMFSLAALADDAAVFQRALDVALMKWRAGHIEEASAKRLSLIMEGTFAMISAEVRTSGEGFLLKQAIAEVRRELAAAQRQSA